MEGSQIGAFAAQFIIALSLAIGWLIMRRVLPGLRMRIGVTMAYWIAATVALGSCFLPAGSPSLSGFVASLVVVALMYSQWKRSLKKHSLDANTIISYDANMIR